MPVGLITQGSAGVRADVGADHTPTAGLWFCVPRRSCCRRWAGGYPSPRLRALFFATALPSRFYYTRLVSLFVVPLYFLQVWLVPVSPRCAALKRRSTRAASERLVWRFVSALPAAPSRGLRLPAYLRACILLVPSWLSPAVRCAVPCCVFLFSRVATAAAQNIR